MRWRKPARPARQMEMCRNEGCNRPAEGIVCETCELEWDLYRRDARRASLSAASPRPR
ncbi:MAG TPA: hypothetical protein VIE39_06220 [Thermoanaerobaculia bacterium]|jgi:hypothetical protein